nr:hypothetical protein [Tanacetum cinerariifolium]
MIGDECDKGIMPTKIEPTLEQSQQGVSNDVLTKLVPQIFLLTWGLFENVFELTNGGIIGGNYVVNDLPLKQSQTSTFENDYKGQVNVEQCAEMMTRIEPSYAPNSSGQHYPLAGPETNYGNIGQAYGAMSQTQDYTMYLKNMSGLNYALRRDLDWVMKKAILRMLSRVFRMCWNAVIVVRVKGRAVDLQRKAYVILFPLGSVKMRPSPAPSLLDALSVYNVQTGVR